MVECKRREAFDKKESTLVWEDGICSSGYDPFMVLFSMRLKLEEDADLHIRTWQGERDYELLELGAKQNKKIWEILNRILYQRRFAFFMPHDAYEIPQVMDICVWQETDRPFHVNLFLSYDLDRNCTVMIGDTEYEIGRAHV